MNLLLADLHKFVGYSGGIEHVLSHMAFAMKEKGYHVSVVMADEKEGASFYPFPEDCHFYNLFHMAGMKPIRMSSLGKGLREITRLFSKAGARERNYRMLSAAAPQLERVLALEKPDVILFWHYHMLDQDSRQVVLSVLSELLYEGTLLLGIFTPVECPNSADGYISMTQKGRSRRMTYEEVKPLLKEVENKRFYEVPGRDQ